METISNTIKKTVGIVPSPDDKNCIIRLTVQVMAYGYGKKGSMSLAARLALGTPENHFEIDEEQTYGELWMGDHQNGPSKSIATGMQLHDLIQLSPEEFLGKSVVEKFKDVQLPFLFKILSFDKALPLQSHPNRKPAEQLMKQEKKESWLGKNKTFVDPNHKPEVAVVLSEMFQGFVGFRPIEEIQDFVRDVPELREAIGEENAKKFESLSSSTVERQLKETFGRVFDDEEKKASKLLSSFMNRVNTEGNKAFGKRGTEEKYLAEVARKLHQRYPGDIGLFGAIFFANLVVLKRGEGIAIQPDVIHAYVDGDVIECMARSDNMLGHGFMSSMDASPQAASLFVSNLLTESGRSSELELHHENWRDRSKHGCIEFYQIPMEEFDILNLVLNDEKREETIIKGGINGPSIWIVTKGTVNVDTDMTSQKERLETGQVIFVKPGTELKFSSVNGSEVEAWAAFCEA